MKITDNNLYFSRNKIRYFEFNFSNLEYITHFSLESFERIKINDINNILLIADKNGFIKICNILENNNWENNESFSENQIIKHISNGKFNYGEFLYLWWRW